MGSSDEQKTFDFTFALTAAEVELFTQITERKRRKIAPYNTYWMLILVSGLALAFAGGAIAHNYYGMALDSNSSVLVTALFAAFLAGVYVYRWTLSAWWQRMGAGRIALLKEPGCLRVGQNGIEFMDKRMEWRAPWQTVEDVTAASGLIVFWIGADRGIAVPLRAIEPAGERAALIELIKKNTARPTSTKEGAASQAR